MKKIVFLLALSFISSAALAQSDEIKAKTLYTNAEKAYNQEKYQNCIDYLNEVEELLGSTQPNILYLKTKAWYKIGNYHDAKKSMDKYFTFKRIDIDSYEYKDMLSLLVELEEKLKEKDTHFRILKRARTFQAFYAYLKAYPYGYKDKYEEIYLINSGIGLKDDATVDVIKRCISINKSYFDAYKSGKTSGTFFDEIQSAQNKLIEKKEKIEQEERDRLAAYKANEPIVFSKAKKDNTISSYKQYISEYPHGKYLAEANAAIDSITKVRRKEEIINNLLVGENVTCGSVYLTKTANTWFIGGIILYPSFPIGLSYDLIGLYNGDKYIDKGISMSRISLYYSFKGGTGFFGKIGYKFGMDHHPNEDYFNTTPYQFQSYSDPSDIYINYKALYYGIGYQNVIGNFFIGIAYEWHTKYYKADPDESINYAGLNEKVKGGSLTLSLGINFAKDGF